jgi:hypothetical protein
MKQEMVMGFRENLQKKIEIDTLSEKVIKSMTPPAKAANFNKSAARQLFEIGEFTHIMMKDRGLKLYILEKGAEKDKIIVLDNGLAIYHTTLADVALRKSPTIKEMISIRNTIKILNDKDVRVSDRGNSMETIRQMLLDRLDLSYEASDIQEIADKGAASLKSKNTNGVLENLTLFSELLGFRNAPKLFSVCNCKVMGSIEKEAKGRTTFGPVVIYNKTDNSLRMLTSKIVCQDPEEVNRYQRFIKDNGPADVNGIEVFRRLQQLVMDRNPELKP